MESKIHVNKKTNLNTLIENSSLYFFDNYLKKSDILSITNAAFISTIRKIQGKKIADKVENEKLQNLHKHFDFKDFTALQQGVKEAIYTKMINFASDICNNHLEPLDSTYICDFLKIRVHAPYFAFYNSRTKSDFLSQAKAGLRNRLGHIVPKFIYNPSAYHNYQHPAIRTHGVHIDTWFGHSYNAANIWIAIDGVDENNTIVFYPDLYGYIDESDYNPRTMYLKEGIRVSKPFRKTMEPGEMVIFNAEIPHGSVINTSGKTRIALTLRVSPQAPTFNTSKSHPVTHNVWAKVTKQKLQNNPVFEALPIVHGRQSFKKKSEPYLSSKPKVHKVNSKIKVTDAGNAIKVILGNHESDFILIDFEDDKIIIFPYEGQHKAFSRICPHQGVDLSDGFIDRESISCPGHALQFSKKTGAARSSICLQKYQVKLSDGVAIVYSEKTEP